MPTRTTSRQRLIQAALGLFAAHGMTETTTKQIAEKAGVNEATLFRQFGNKNGLLLAVLEEGNIFQRLSQVLIHQVDQLESEHFEQVLLHYATAFLRSLDQAPELVRSLIGEAGRYPTENRVALGQGFTQANQCVADYFTTVLARAVSHDRPTLTLETDPSDILELSPHRLASMLHSALLGYAAIELTSTDHELWPSRAVFLDSLVPLLCASVGALPDSISGSSMLEPAIAQNSNTPISDLMQVLPAQAPPAIVADLPATLVHEILLRAKKRNNQDYAILYTLFATGITPQELVKLQRIHHVSDRDQHILQVMPVEPRTGISRQVPVNQWIMGKRYGTYVKNPLTQWLKSRKDEIHALFLTAEQTALALVDIETLSQEISSDLMTVTGRSPHLTQIQQTWCVDLLMRGVTPENMQILTGWTLEKLTPYIQRAKEKAAIDQVMQLDKKN